MDSARGPSENRELSTRRLLVRRLRIVLLICLVSGLIFTVLEVWVSPTELGAPFVVKLIGIIATSCALVSLQYQWARRWAWPLSILYVAAAYFLTGLSAMVSPSREYATTAVLFVGAALTTATILPWGVAPQVTSVAVGVLTLAVAIIRADGGLHGVVSDPGAAVVIALALSLLAAREVNRYRLAHRRELQTRRQAELKVRRLNTQLEQRVHERTVELQTANRMLADEIRARQQANEALRRQQNDLAHVLRLHSIEEMAAALAHEINQPLCAITNYAQGSAQRLRSQVAAPGELLQAFEQIAVEGLRAGRIIRGIRDLVTRQAGEREPVDLNALASEAVRILEPQARLYHVSVHLHGAAQLPLVDANGTQVEQVMLNLILNGIEAVETAVNGSREVVVTTAAGGGCVEVEVSDSGPGIEATVADKLFTPFFTTKPRGLGLGLAISRSIVESHGGELRVAASTSGGASFRFSLPTG